MANAASRRAIDRLPQKPNLRPGEVAEFLDVSLTMVYDMIHTGDLPSLKIGAHYRIPRDSFVKTLEDGLVFKPGF
jgi:excisionase family DNA binding protein